MKSIRSLRTSNPLRAGFIICLTSILFSVCLSCKQGSTIKFGDFPLPVPALNPLLARWEEKIVTDSLIVDNMEQDGQWTGTNTGKTSYTDERSIDGSRSLRFSTSLRDTANYRKNRTAWDSYDGVYGGNSAAVLRFEKPADWSAYNRISFWVFVHPSSVQTHCLVLDIANAARRRNVLQPSRWHHITDLKPGEWNHVLFEIPHLRRDSITSFSIGQHLTGQDDIETFDIDKLELQVVDTDPYEGWSVAPEMFSFSHAGYRPEDSKIALVGHGGEERFSLVNERGNTVFEGVASKLETSRGSFRQLDFSGLKTEGVYRIRYGSLVSGSFPVRKDIWLDPLYKSINFYFCERCGFEVPGIHPVCHKDWTGFHGDIKKIINGGWHDAGDLSQGAWRTSMGVYSMLRTMEYLEGKPDAYEVFEKLRDESAWGLEWMLRTRFGDGYHMSWSTMRIYTDNQTGTIDDVVSPAENVPWENFLASAVQGLAAEMLVNSHPELASRSRIAAKEDWEAAMASCSRKTKIGYLEASWGTLSSIQLWKMTGDSLFKEKAVEYCNMILQCQEQSFVDSIPLTGYFYTDTGRDRILHNNAFTGFEEAPLAALAMICREFPDHKNWISWYSAAVLYGDYYLKRGSRITAPYYLLPNSIWKKSEILAEMNERTREVMMTQFNDGTRLSDEYVLRIFPLYRNGALGSSNTQLSYAWALAEASALRNDTAGMQLVGRQLEWVLGGNPFCQSLMYGVGNNYPPLSAHSLVNIAGALPCGIDCLSGDMPFWSASNMTTFKEIWTEPVSRFIGTVAVYALRDNVQPVSNTRDIRISAQTHQHENGVVELKLQIEGKGRHELDIKAYNCSADSVQMAVNLSEGSPEKRVINLTVNDKNRPFVAVIIPDNNPAAGKEITGSYINTHFAEK